MPTYRFHWTPKSKERPRTPRGGGRSYTPRATLEAEKAIREQWPSDVPPIEGQCRVDIGFTRDEVIFEIEELPPRDTKGKGNRDLDNVTKLVTDALNGVAYLDDKQIVDLRGEWLANG